MHITTDYTGVKKGDTNYLFFLLTEDYIQSHRKIKEDLMPLLNDFARDIGNKGVLVMPFSGFERHTRADIFSKRWGYDARKALEKTPGILIINSDFEKFDPSKDPWIHFTLRDYIGDSADVSLFELHDFLSRIANYCFTGKNIFEMAILAIKKDEDKLPQNGKNFGKLKKLYDCFELKPGIFGFSFDIKKGIELLDLL